MSATTPSDYESNAILAIHQWKQPGLTWWDSAMRIINKPLDVAGDLATKIPGFEVVTEKAFKGIVGLLNDGAALSVRPAAILAEFQPPLAQLPDVYGRDLADVDRAIGFLAAKYKSIALVEGAAAGGVSTVNPVAGAAAMAADITALLAMNLRAIAEYATYCGFDVRRQEERLFALNVLQLASSPTDNAKSVALAQLVRIAKDVAQRKTWRELEKHAFVKAVQEMAKALSIRLTKAKLAQLVPAAGAAIGGGFNAYYTSEVCEAAYFLYRERFLGQKYGETVIEATVVPAADGDLGSVYGAEIS